MASGRRIQTHLKRVVGSLVASTALRLLLARDKADTTDCWIPALLFLCHGKSSLLGFFSADRRRRGGGRRRRRSRRIKRGEGGSSGDEAVDAGVPPASGHELSHEKDAWGREKPREGYEAPCFYTERLSITWGGVCKATNDQAKEKCKLPGTYVRTCVRKPDISIPMGYDLKIFIFTKQQY